jgi:hypothetical protein
MIGKVMIGKSFAGLVRYNIGKPEARTLDASGVRTKNMEQIIHDFNMQRKLNPDLGKAVGHIALSWSIHDKDKLTPEIMVLRAKDYMEGMKIKNTQYLIVQHNDKEHPHIHIIYNRVNNEGKTISDQFQKQLNAKVTMELKLKYGYYMGENKNDVKRSQLKGADKVKYELYDRISKVIKQAIGWQQVEDNLKNDGIGIIYKYKSGTKEIQGISFSKDGIQFKGSQIDRSLSYGNIDKQLKENLHKALAEILNKIDEEKQQCRTDEAQGDQPEYLQEHGVNEGESFEESADEAINSTNFNWSLEDLLSGAHGNATDEDDQYKRRKRNNGMSR